MTQQDYVDCWNTLGAARGESFDLGIKATRYVRVHRHNAYNDGAGDDADDLVGTGVNTWDRAKRAREAGAEIILCCEYRHDRRHPDPITGLGVIQPVNVFGRHPWSSYMNGPRYAREMVKQARRYKATVLNVLNEAFSWHDSPPLGKWEALVWSVLNEIERTGGGIKVVCDWNPAMSSDLAAAVWRVDKHMFRRSGETLPEFKSRIQQTAQAIRARGGLPTCLEWTIGRNISHWTEQGAGVHREVRRYLTNCGYHPIGLGFGWGGYPGSEEIWGPAYGWGTWRLWLTTESEVSIPAREIAAEVAGEPPVPEPPLEKIMDEEEVSRTLAHLESAEAVEPPLGLVQKGEARKHERMSRRRRERAMVMLREALGVE